MCIKTWAKFQISLTKFLLCRRLDIYYYYKRLSSVQTYLSSYIKLKFKKFFHSAFHPNFRFQLSQQQPEIKNSQVIKCIWNPWILMLLLRVWIYEFVRNDIARVFCSMKKTCGRVGRQRGWGEKNFNRLSPCFFLFKGSYFFKHCYFYVEHM